MWFDNCACEIAGNKITKRCQPHQDFVDLSWGGSRQGELTHEEWLKLRNSIARMEAGYEDE